MTTKISPRRCDLRSLKLSPEEGFVLSRVDAPMSLEDLAALSGLGEGRVLEIVETLARQGAVDVEGILIPEIAPIEEIPEIPALEPIPVEPLALAIGGVCDVGQARTNNEDALAVVDFTGLGPVDVLGKRRALEVGARGVLLAVSDGMGGENAGEVASAMVLETMTAYLSEHDTSADAAGTLAAAVAEANAKVMAAAEQRELSGMGATLIAFFVADGAAITAEIGDSRAYVLRQDNLTQLSKDQSHVGLLVAQGILTAEDAKKSRAKNVILQACGKLPELVVAQRTLALRGGDRLLLCSDGLTLHVEDREIEEVLVSVASPDEASAKLVAMANERGGKDNVTVLVANVEGAAPPAGPDDTLERALTVVREFGTVGE